MNAEPIQFRAGDTVRWRRYVDGFSALDGWALSYRFTCATGKFDLTCTADDAGFVALIAAIDSATYAPGVYTWAAFVKNDAGERHTIATGNTNVQPDIAAQEVGTDQRSQARISLDNITAFLGGTAAKGVAEYEIHGRSIKYHSIADLMSLRSLFQSIVNQEEAAAGQRTPRRRVLTGFGRSC